MENAGEGPFARVGVAGLGLIGGSMALALERAGRTVAGFDADPAVVHMARKAGIPAANTPDALFGADLLFIALYPDAAIAFVRENAARFRKGCVVVDCCGIKSRIMAALPQTARDNGFVFIGGHPMAGREINGFSAASASLFDGASFLLTPPEGTDEKTLAALTALLSGLGFSRVVTTTAAHHDRMIAFTSQLPHALACAYVLSSSCPGHDGYSAGSYRDISRVAHINPPLWAELFLENKKAFCAEADEMLDHLSKIRDAVESEDHEALEALLRRARERKDRDSSPQKGEIHG